jgi:poly [ADP-ribose] polymerase
MSAVIEQAKSSRASCRKCKGKIEKDTLRFGVESDMQYGDEPSFRWYHLACGASVDPVALEKLLATYEGEIEGREEIEKAIADGKKKKKPSFPYAEVAPSGRSTCMGCDEKIEKGQLRVAVEREVDTGAFVTKGAGYLHVGCAVEHTGDGELAAKVIANSHQLSAEEKADLESAFADG